VPSADDDYDRKRRHNVVYRRMNRPMTPDEAPKHHIDLRPFHLEPPLPLVMITCAKLSAYTNNFPQWYIGTLSSHPVMKYIISATHHRRKHCGFSLLCRDISKLRIAEHPAFRTWCVGRDGASGARRDTAGRNIQYGSSRAIASQHAWSLGRLSNLGIHWRRSATG
jgi:hypothetical protein